MKINKQNFSNFFENIFNHGGKIPNFIRSILNSKSKELLYQSLNSNNNLNFHILNFVPDYFKFDVNQSISKKEVVQYQKAYASFLGNYNSVDEYIKNQFKKNARHIFKRKKRLELCFEIEYVKYYGYISKMDYNFLMTSLKIMLERRFKQRNETNKYLKSWEHLYENTFMLIREKKASIFAIFNNKTPIQVSIQSHFGDIMHSLIIAYDIDYSKFSLGNTAVYEQIKWCYINNYKILDQGYGYLEYKRLWSNYIYRYKYMIFFNKKSLKSILRGHVMCFKLNILEYLKSKEFLRVLKDNFLGTQKATKPLNSLGYKFAFKDLDEEIPLNKLTVFNIEDFSPLKQIVFDFLYLNASHIDTVQVFKIDSEIDTFLISGEKKKQKVIFQKR
ncbi:hypothetical protein DIS18_08800 [Algibacter marinivivus]|uniref:BioF2-like acetyltransferase domain-containing protein n=1 Tax=Algibacter marinivivus TaxID=2100723 RepID=A0A2U2X3I6_9FLAO|nr:GNAT family N-acetyltransferase [Algibacter marinivivus]PWH82342.1 hypothetical protein DIS18_08800 [Algibacter marinivivus]